MQASPCTDRAQARSCSEPTQSGWGGKPGGTNFHGEGEISAVGDKAAHAQAGTAATSDTAPRLRITSTTGSSLRVQNYLYNAATGQIVEVSGSQAVDYEGNNILRAPVSDGQYISQDANSGLNLNP